MQKTELKPSYYAQFQCIGGECEDTCCAGWRIEIDKKTYQKYKNEKNPTIKNALKKNIKRNRQNQNDFQYAYFQLDNDNKCTMLNEEHLCTIQKTLGEEALCRTCMVYPRQNIQLNQTIEKSLDPSCPEAARLILLNKDGIDFIEDEAIQPNYWIEHVEKKDDAYAYFWSNRIFFISALQHRKHSIEMRLLLIGLYIKKMESLSLKERMQQTEQLSAYYLNLLDTLEIDELLTSLDTNYILQEQLAQFFLKEYGTNSVRFRELADSAFKNVDFLSKNTSFNNFITQHNVEYKEHIDAQIILENYLVNLVFLKYFETNEQTNIQFFSYLMIHFVLLRLLIIGNMDVLELNDTNMVKMIQSFSKACTHNSSYFSEATRIISSSEYSLTSQAINLLKI